MTYEPETGLLYVPVSNPVPDFEGARRPGDNLYTCSIIVLDLKTGKLVWYYQVSPHDTHDYDLTQASPQFDDDCGGQKAQSGGGRRQGRHDPCARPRHA